MAMTATWEVVTRSADETRALGRALGSCLVGGECVALRGDLGAGKTTFAGGLGEGLGVSEPLTSPTYVLCCEYEGTRPVLHLDAYFRERMDSLLGEGLAERLAGPEIVLVEWADRVEEWLADDRLDVELSGRDDTRTVRFSATGAVSGARLEALAEGWAPSEGTEEG